MCGLCELSRTANKMNVSISIKGILILKSKNMSSLTFPPIFETLHHAKTNTNVDLTLKF